jgi:hypothetical protein
MFAVISYKLSHMDIPGSVEAELSLHINIYYIQVVFQ